MQDFLALGISHHIYELLTIRALVLENQAISAKVNELQEELNNIRKSFNIKSNSIMDNYSDNI